MSSPSLKDFYNQMSQKTFRFGHQFLVKLMNPPIPGLDKINKDGTFSFYVKSTKIPKISIGDASISFMSNGFVLPGTVTYPDSWTVDILLDQDLTIYKLLREWQETISSINYNGGGNKLIPITEGQVELLNPTFTGPDKTFIVKRYLATSDW